MKSSKLLLVFLALSLLACSMKGTLNTAEPTKFQESNGIDYALIKEWVKDKRIVGLGECTHGLGEMFAFKSELVQYLHRELGFEVLAIEGGMGDISLAWEDVDEMTGSELRDCSLFGNFRCKEINGLFDYIKDQSTSNNPLIYAGFDIQSSGNYLDKQLNKISSLLDLEIDIKEGFAAYYNMYQSIGESDSTNFTTYKTTFQSTLLNLKESIENNSSQLLESREFNQRELDIILQSLHAQYEAVNYHFSERLNDEYIQQGIVLRDLYMAKNLQWIIDELHPDKKVIVWGHNGHIHKGGFQNLNTPWMGQHLSEIYGGDYFSIGLFAYKGNAYSHWTKQSSAFENNSDMAIELKMKREGNPYGYQLFNNEDAGHWVNQEVTALEIENGGQMKFIPSERFDAGINIVESDVPTFD